MRVAEEESGGVMRGA